MAARAGYGRTEQENGQIWGWGTATPETFEPVPKRPRAPRVGPKFDDRITSKGRQKIAIDLLGLLLAWAGGAWDVAWHHTIGRDTFWTA